MEPGEELVTARYCKLIYCIKLELHMEPGEELVTARYCKLIYCIKLGLNLARCTVISFYHIVVECELIGPTRATLDRHVRRAFSCPQIN